jgi:hypothetical protein
MSATKKTDRIYLRDDETKVLQSFLQEWSAKSDKKTRDAFVSGTAVPKIQGLNLKEYGPDVISTNKVAKVRWEKRVTVSHLRLFFGIFKDLALMLGGLHMVYKSQAVQGQAGVQARKKDPTPAGCRKGEGHGDQ